MKTRIDILENEIVQQYPDVLDILIRDHTTQKNKIIENFYKLFIYKDLWLVNLWFCLLDMYLTQMLCQSMPF